MELIGKVVGFRELDKQKPIFEIEIKSEVKNVIDWLIKEVEIKTHSTSSDT